MAHWVCGECGNKWGTHSTAFSTWHLGKCDVCNQKASVTEKRDFGHLQKGIEALGGKKRQPHIYDYF